MRRRRTTRRGARGPWMSHIKFGRTLAVIGLALSLAALASCASNTQRQPGQHNQHRNGRTVELPGGGPSEEEQARQNQVRPPNWFERMLGRDDRPNVGPCPLMGVLYESSRLVKFDQPNVERYANIQYTGEVRGIRGLCRYVETNPIRMAVEIDMAFGRGPAATSDRQHYRYWVAVARRGLAPIEKQYFDVNVQFPHGQDTVTTTERIGYIVIPRAQADTSGENFEILVGFDLTPDQLAFNRAGKRFRVDSGQNTSPPPAAQQQSSTAPPPAAH